MLHEAHTLLLPRPQFWESMTPSGGGGQPAEHSPLLGAIERDFGSFSNMKVRRSGA